MIPWVFRKVKQSQIHNFNLRCFIPSVYWRLGNNQQNGAAVAAESSRGSSGCGSTAFDGRQRQRRSRSDNDEDSGKSDTSSGEFIPLKAAMWRSTEIKTTML